MDNRRVIVLLTCLVITNVVHCAIWSKDLYPTDGFRTVKLSSGKEDFAHILARGKRDTSSGKLAVNTTTLEDKNHNEAIVHWSGKDSKVCIFRCIFFAPVCVK